jgi:hypothetical protein
MKTIFLLVILLCPVLAQSGPSWQCEQNLIFSNNGQTTDGITTIALIGGAATGPNYNNKSQKCAGWIMSYSVSGLSAISLQLQSAAEGPSIFAAFQGTVVTGTNPSTVTTSNTLVVLGYYPYLNISVASSTGTGFINVSLRGYVNMNQVVGTQIINRGLVGHWALNEGSGSLAFDSSRYGNLGTWQGTAGGTSGYYSAGKVGQWAGNFNDSNNYITIPNSNSLEVSGAISLAAWVYPKAFGTYQTIIIKGTYLIRDYSLYLPTLTSSISLALGGGSNPGSLTISTSWVVDAWNHLVVTVNGTQIIIYLNGVAVNTTASTVVATTSTNPTYIGEDANDSAYYMNGYLNDVRVYNRALSAAEVQILYNVTNNTNSL